MTGKLLKGLVIAVSGGLGLSVGLKLGQRTRQRPSESFDLSLADVEAVEVLPSSGDRLRDPAVWNALLDRQLEPVNRRIGRVEQRLRADLDSARRQYGDGIDSVNQRITQLENRMPVEIAAAVEPRLAELGRKLEKDFEQFQSRTLDALAGTLEARLHRISGLESSLSGQSEAIAELREKSLRTEQNIEKLLLAVERLCERTERQLTHSPQDACAGIPAEERGFTMIKESAPAGPANPPSREADPASLIALEQNAGCPAAEEADGAPDAGRLVGGGLDLLDPQEALAKKWRLRFGFS
jgi:hypothetical protein